MAACRPARRVDVRPRRVDALPGRVDALPAGRREALMLSIGLFRMPGRRPAMTK
jgi:hypothetical protein